MYDPALARWMVQDVMIENHTDYSPYAYVYNNPIRFTDQFGLDTFLVDNMGHFAKEAISGGENDVIVSVSRKERRKGTIDYSKNHKSENFEKGSIHKKETGGFLNRKTLVTTNNNESKKAFNFLSDNSPFGGFYYNDYLFVVTGDFMKENVNRMIFVKKTENSLRVYPSKLPLKGAYTDIFHFVEKDSTYLILINNVCGSKLKL